MILPNDFIKINFIERKQGHLSIDLGPSPDDFMTLLLSKYRKAFIDTSK